MSYIFITEVFKCRKYGVGSCLSETAEGVFFDIVAKFFHLVEVFESTVTGSDLVEEFEKTFVTDTAGSTFTAAFVNGECRGSARPIYVEALDAYMLFLTIHGEEVEEMTFKYYDIDTDTEYTLSDRINYSNKCFITSKKSMSTSQDISF